MTKIEEGDGFLKSVKSTCSICGRKIPSEEFYSRSILTGKLICSNCDKGVLIKGDLLFFPNE